MSKQKIRPAIRLHLGAHRTGSTHLQRMLDDKRQKLNELGIEVLTPPRPGKRDVYSVRALFKAYYGQYKRKMWSGPATKLLTSKLTNDARHQLNQLIDPEATQLVLSDENFLGPIIQPKSGSGLYPLAGKHLKTLADLLDNKVESIHLVCRQYDKFLISSYLMQFIYDNARYEFEEWKQQALSDNFSWVTLIENIQQNFADVPLKVWQLEQADINRCFRMLVGSRETEDWQFEDYPRINMAPTKSAIEAFQALENSKNLNHTERDELIAKHANGASFEEGYFFNVKEVELLFERYTRDMLSLRDISGVKMC